MMVSAYVELSAALTMLADSGQLNTGASLGVRDLAEVPRQLHKRVPSQAFL